MKAIIGSQVIHKHFPNRKPKDWDIITDEPKKGIPGKLEYLRVKPEQPAMLSILEKFNGGMVDLETLITIKLSHIFWDINWKKHIEDIEFLLAKGVEYDSELYQKLRKEWEVVHGKKRAFLKKKNEEFFKDAVKREFEHDYIHRCVAYYDEPMFEKIKPDKSMAMCSKKMFDSLSHEDKIKTCREEIYVTALERFIIPSEYKDNASIANKRAIHKLVTSMTKGWFPEFIVLNWGELKNPDIDYVAKFRREHERRTTV